MIKHIVFWKFLDQAEGAGKNANLAKARDLLQGLPEEIPQIRLLEVAVGVQPSPQSYDLVLYSHFDDLESLAAYQRHPAHLRVVEFLRKVQSARAVVDYEA
jgi:hypothetical protein